MRRRRKLIRRKILHNLSNNNSNRYSNNNMKNRVTAGLLACFLGSFGVHRFYLGQIGRGFLYLIFFWTGLPAIIGLIDSIILLSMGDAEFNYKYNPYYLLNRRNQNNSSLHTNNQGSYHNNHGNSLHVPPKKKVDNTSNKFKDEGTKLYKKYDFKGAIQSYIQSLKIQPNDPQINFNLACLYSLEEDTNSAFIHLQRAVEQGYSDFDKIKTHDHLAFLRMNPKFDGFVNNGYTLTKKATAKLDKEDELTAEDFDRLERLAALRDKGILTEEEFQTQKDRLLG